MCREVRPTTRAFGDELDYSQHKLSYIRHSVLTIGEAILSNQSPPGGDAYGKARLALINDGRTSLHRRALVADRGKQS